MFLQKWMPGTKNQCGQQCRKNMDHIEDRTNTKTAEDTKSGYGQKKSRPGIVAEGQKMPTFLRGAKALFMQLQHGPGTGRITAGQTQQQRGKPCWTEMKQRAEKTTEYVAGEIGKAQSDQQTGDSQKGE